MAQSDSDDDANDDLEFDTRTSDAEGDADGDGEEDAEIDEDFVDALEADVIADDATEGDDDSASDDSEEGSDEDDDDSSEPSGDPPMEVDEQEFMPPRTNTPPSNKPSASREVSRAPSEKEQRDEAPPPRSRSRSLSPAEIRRKTLVSPAGRQAPRTYTVEAVCAIPHPVPTHALASSACMTHLLTGSDDGYIRDYDIFTALNGKVFLTAPQRHHCGVVEGLMKAGQIRSWWENPDMTQPPDVVTGADEPTLSPVYSLAMHSDAMWALAGTDAGHINLFTVRHEPGRLIHVMNGHRGPVSSLCLEHDEKGFFSAGWDGEALQWDLNTGVIARKFTAHGAQLTGIAVRPVGSASPGNTSSDYESAPGAMHVEQAPASTQRHRNNSTASNKGANAPPGSGQSHDSDTKSDASFDPLFDDEPDDDDPDSKPNSRLAISNSFAPAQSQPTTFGTAGSVAPPKNAPPLLEAPTYADFSPDILMTSSIDGQIILWDKRVNTPGKGVGRLWMSEKTPPWCLSACWSADGGQIYAGRRNGTIDIWDTRQLGRSGPNGTPRLLKTLRNPLSSGVVSCVVAFPDGRHIACASNDNIRLWNAAEAGEPDSSGKMKSGVQFKIIPGHHGGYVSQMIVDPGARFLVSASSNRGWHGDSTRTVFVHDVKLVH
ncbi:hypothetical protein PLICRDRAFT_623739 [Plicaturopsis crispa FD-325 SS-3]|nr:hypothetical protein PLICRDRAFT_623739 [Plicaturopsis crispa FD-325 SS-3]